MLMPQNYEPNDCILKTCMLLSEVVRVDEN